MCASRSFNQFQPDPDNKEITDLQKNVAILEKRLDDVQKSTSISDTFTKMLSLQTEMNQLQNQIDDASKSGRKGVADLTSKFNSLKSSMTTKLEQLSKKIDGVEGHVQANSDNDKISDCWMHLDARRCKVAANIADTMPTTTVTKLIKDYGGPDNKHKENRKEILSEFIGYLNENSRRSSFESLLEVILPTQVKVKEPLFVGGTLLSNELYQSKLNEFYGTSEQKWELIYKGTQHGFGPTAFHKHCDGQAPTLIVIQSRDKSIFGGFTKLPWSHNRGFKQDTDAFLFTLRNPNNNVPMKFPITKDQSQHAVYHPGAGYLGEMYDYYLFGFGGDGLKWFNFVERTDYVTGLCRGDLFIAANCNKNNCSTIRFPCSYTDTSGYGYKAFNGATHFTVKDIEIYVTKKMDSFTTSK